MSLRSASILSLATAASGLRVAWLGATRGHVMYRSPQPRMSILLADEQLAESGIAEEPSAVAEQVEELATAALESTAEGAATIINTFSDSDVDAEAIVAAAGEYAPLALVLLSVPLLFSLIKALLGAVEAATEAAKPLLTTALGLLVVILGFGASAELSKLPLIGGLLGSPSEIFLKLTLLTLAAGASAVAYAKVSEAAASVNAGIDVASSKVKEARDNVTGRIESVTGQATGQLSSVADQATGQVTSLQDKVKVSVPLQNLKNPFRTPDEDSYVQPKRSVPSSEDYYSVQEEYEEEYEDEATSLPVFNFGAKFEDKIKELKERDAKRARGE